MVYASVVVFEVRRQDEVSRVLKHRRKPGGSVSSQAEQAGHCKEGGECCGRWWRRTSTSTGA
jgi:hypothetical protein